MATTNSPAERETSRWSLRAFAARPRLALSIGLGAAVGLALAFASPGASPSTCAILGWDVTCAAFIISVTWMMAGKTPPDIRRTAAAQDEGKLTILAFVTVAAAASLAAVAVELSLAKQDHGLLKAGRIALAFGTVAASWFVVQLVFALHYAHDYYLPGKTPASIAGGLAFPGKNEPDYWDFVHFSVVIGVASQTADICFTGQPLRRLGTVHSVLAFTFNTVVLALTINLLAGLF